MKNKGIYYGSLLLVVVANVGYHLSSRSIPAQGNQFLGVGFAYIIAFLVCMICVILFKKPILKEDLKQTSKRYLFFGLFVPGLEAGFILMYHHGWQVSQGALVADILTSAILATIGILYFGDRLGIRSIVGIILCFIGVILAAV